METRTGTRRRSIAGIERESFGELFGELANDSSALVRDEFQLAKQEISEKIVSFRAAAILIVTGAAIGSLAMMTLAASAVIGLAHYVGPGYSALIIGGVLLIIAAVVVSTGLKRVNQINFKPEQTITTLQEDKEWLKELT